MAKAGRKPKIGKRTMSGRLSRSGQPTHRDKGTDHTQAIQALYGPDGCDAIGRAYRAGLLGNDHEAKAMLDKARAISNAYWAAYANGAYQCPLGDRTHGSITNIDHDKIERREQQLASDLAFVQAMGRNVRWAFDQLVIDVYPDSGPRWLDELIWWRSHGLREPIGSTAILRAALDALELLS